MELQSKLQSVLKLKKHIMVTSYQNLSREDKKIVTDL